VEKDVARGRGELYRQIGQLKVEKRFFVQEARQMSRVERRAMVDREDPAPAVTRQCELLAISRSSVYRRPVEVSEKDHTIMAMIDRQYLARPFYGSRRMAAWLATPGYPVGRKRVQRLMRLMGLVAIYQRPNTSNAAADKIYPYLLGGLTIDRVNQVRCSESLTSRWPTASCIWWRSWIGTAGPLPRDNQTRELATISHTSHGGTCLAS
jgi:putative transposase